RVDLERPRRRSGEERLMNEGSALSLSKIEQISINAHDLDRAVEFYRDKLGLKHLFTVPPSMAFFDCGGIRLMVGLPSEPKFDHPSSIIYFNVEDIQQAYQTLSNRGVEFEQPPAFVANMGAYDLWI